MTDNDIEYLKANLDLFNSHRIHFHYVLYWHKSIVYIVLLAALAASVNSAVNHYELDWKLFCPDSKWAPTPFHHAVFLASFFFILYWYYIETSNLFRHYNKINKFILLVEKEMQSKTTSFQNGHGFIRKYFMRAVSHEKYVREFYIVAIWFLFVAWLLISVVVKSN